VELRPELQPPILDEEWLDRLAELADKLDGCQSDEGDAMLAEFNQAAGTELAIENFQKIYCSEDHKDWVRRILYQRDLRPDPRLSKEEMAEIVSRIQEGDDNDFYLELFLVNCLHPAGTELIYWPDEVPELPRDREATATEIAELAMRKSGQA